MKKIDVKVQAVSPFAVMPFYATDGDAGADLCAVDSAIIPAHDRALVSTGLCIEIPEGHVGLVHPRSGLAAKRGITVLNAPGTIDSGYRGVVKVILYNTTNQPFFVQSGDRIAQLVVQEYVHGSFVEVESLDETQRGDGGFGSTGM